MDTERDEKQLCGVHFMFSLVLQRNGIGNIDVVVKCDSITIMFICCIMSNTRNILTMCLWSASNMTLLDAIT